MVDNDVHPDFNLNKDRGEGCSQLIRCVRFAYFKWGKKIKQICTNTVAFLFLTPDTRLPSATKKNPIGMHFCAILKVSYATKTESQVMADAICPVPHTLFRPNSRNCTLPVTRSGSHTIFTTMAISVLFKFAKGVLGSIHGKG